MKEIQLSRGMVALVDDEMFDRVNYFKWSATKIGKIYYAETGIWANGKRTAIYMHRLIMGFPNALIDHADGNGLNNKISNLRSATKSQNAMNAGKQNGVYTSKYRGVTWYRRDGKWQAFYHKNGKKKHLGYFDSEDEAAYVRDQAVVNEHGKYAFINKVRTV